MSSVLGMRRRISGQSAAEYAIVLTIVITAVVAMQVYVKRGLNARLKDGSDSAGDSLQRGLTSGGFPTLATATEQKQYEPTFSSSDYNVRHDTDAESGWKPTAASKKLRSDQTIREDGGKQETLKVQ